MVAAVLESKTFVAGLWRNVRSILHSTEIREDVVLLAEGAGGRGPYVLISLVGASALASGTSP